MGSHGSAPLPHKGREQCEYAACAGRASTRAAFIGAVQNSFFGRSATGGRKAGVKISLDRRRARQSVGLDQDVDRLLQPLRDRHCRDRSWRSPDGSSRPAAWHRAARFSTRNLDQRLALGDRGDRSVGVLERVDQPLVDGARRGPPPPSGFSLTSFLETMMALE